MLSSQSAAFWRAFATTTRVDAKPAGQFRFGDSAELADELIELILHGPKRATAGLRCSFTEAEPLPIVGDYWIVLDGRDTPRAVIRSLEVTVKPFSQVDERFAWDEGEGDRSLGWWVAAHTAYFTREAARLGYEMHPDIDVVFERFELVWPVTPSL